jgi:hypothetical protein
VQYFVADSQHVEFLAASPHLLSIGLRYFDKEFKWLLFQDPFWAVSYGVDTLFLLRWQFPSSQDAPGMFENALQTGFCI